MHCRFLVISQARWTGCVVWGRPAAAASTRCQSHLLICCQRLRLPIEVRRLELPASFPSTSSPVPVRLSHLLSGNIILATTSCCSSSSEDCGCCALLPNGCLEHGLSTARSALQLLSGRQPPPLRGLLDITLHICVDMQVSYCASSTSLQAERCIVVSNQSASVDALALTPAY